MDLYEAHHFGANDEIKAYTANSLVFKRHYHRSYEFFYLTEGSSKVFVDTETFSLNANEGILICPNQIHSYISNGSKGKIIIFSPNLVMYFYRKFHDYLPLNPCMALDNSLLNMFNSCVEDLSDIFGIKSCLYALCSVYFKAGLVKRKVSYSFDIMHNTLKYLEENFARDITLQTLASELGYNYHYISRLMNQRFNSPFCKILSEYRISNAIELLLYTDGKITQIAYQCGFNNIRSFNRTFFDVTGKTPSDYRDGQ